METRTGITAKHLDAQMNFVLTHPVTTLEGKVLMPEGAELSAETVEGFLGSCPAAPSRMVPLLAHGSIREDLVSFVEAPPYGVIFSDGILAEIMRSMEKVRLVEPALHVLDYFQLNDYYTYRHFLTVFALSSLLARDLMPDSGERSLIESAGPTHDIGKICVPLRLLRKTSPLRRSERRALESHTAAGYVLLSYYLGDPGGLGPRVSMDHHERLDGSGYPRGIPQEDMMVEIIAACDVYDALISPRPYRTGSYDNRTALEEITAMAEGGRLRWDVVRALVAHNRKSRPHYSESEVSTEKRGIPPLTNFHGMVVEDEE